MQLYSQLVHLTEIEGILEASLEIDIWIYIKFKTIGNTVNLSILPRQWS